MHRTRHRGLAGAAALSLAASLALAACTERASDIAVPGLAEPTRFDYTPPATSGLIGLRPYPNPDDVCMVMGENDVTRAYLDDAALLIGCPKHEQGAIGDRWAEGARIVGHAGHWTLLGTDTPSENRTPSLVAPTRYDYTPPAESGLIGLRAYPAPADVCMVMGENDVTRAHLDDAALLIGCPKHEQGAIGDRWAEGARIVGHARHWTLMRVPQR